jgi:hypothetical protein
MTEGGWTSPQMPSVYLRRAVAWHAWRKRSEQSQYDDNTLKVRNTNGPDALSNVPRN